jgi:hypothetical protein
MIVGCPCIKNDLIFKKIPSDACLSASISSYKPTSTPMSVGKGIDVDIKFPKKYIHVEQVEPDLKSMGGEC